MNYSLAKRSATFLRLNSRAVRRAFSHLRSLVYVSTSMDTRVRGEPGPDEGEPEGSEPSGRVEVLAERVGADRIILLPVCLSSARKRPCERTVSLRAKRDDRRHPIWSAPALIAGEIMDLNLAINLGGAVRL